MLALWAIKHFFVLWLTDYQFVSLELMLWTLDFRYFTSSLCDHNLIWIMVIWMNLPRKGDMFIKRGNIAPFPVSIPSMSRDDRYFVLYGVLCTPLVCGNSGWVFFCVYCQCCPFSIFVTFVIHLYRGLLVVPFLFLVSLMWNLCRIFK